jgi:parallel beta-helix repeat protein
MKGNNIQIICLVFVFVFWAAVMQVDAGVITVNNNGGGSYGTLQEAVNNAQNGDVILVSSGVYKENIRIDKELTILSHCALAGDLNDRTYILSTVPEKDVIDVYSNNVTIEGLYFLGNPSGMNIQNIGIYLEGVQNCSLNNNTFVMSNPSIVLNSSQSNYLNNNLISLGSDGIVLKNSDNNLLSNNLVVTDKHGILLNNSVNNTFINEATGISVTEIYKIEGSIDLMPPLSRFFSENNSENMSRNRILLALLNKKFSKDSRDTQNKSEVNGVNELAQINTSLQEGPVFLRIGAEWCPSCQATKPILKELATEYGQKATVMTIDVDQKPELKDYFGTRYIPDCSVIVGIENGEYVYIQENGSISKDRTQARSIGLKEKELFEKLLDLALLRGMKEKS